MGVVLVGFLSAVVDAEQIAVLHTKGTLEMSRLQHRLRIDDVRLVDFVVFKGVKEPVCWLHRHNAVKW